MFVSYDPLRKHHAHIIHTPSDETGSIVARAAAYPRTIGFGELQNGKFGAVDGQLMFNDDKGSGA